MKHIAFYESILHNVTPPRGIPPRVDATHGTGNVAAIFNVNNFSGRVAMTASLRPAASPPPPSLPSSLITLYQSTSPLSSPYFLLSFSVSVSYFTLLLFPFPPVLYPFVHCPFSCHYSFKHSFITRAFTYFLFFPYLYSST